MTDALTHRGPDDRGSICLGPVALGHRRLSIIDLSPAGRQPMSDASGRVWITFNGEFYDFRQWRQDLLEKGYSFRSQTDTEVILNLYCEYGWRGTLEKLTGMFAFALYDAERGKLLFARDRLGIKPCYYAVLDDLFLWGSELKAILEHPGFRARISSRGLQDYLMYSYVPDPNTIFEGVHKLLPGESLELDIESFSIRRSTYWDVLFEPDETRREIDVLDELDALMTDTVRKYLISDAPFGAFLSGGIDSTLVVSYMARVMDRPVSTFSIGFQEAGFSEVAWARQVAEKFSTDHHERQVTPDALALLPKLAYHYDEPFGDHSAVPTYYVSAMARENVTVVLSGDGGDENFAGYPKYDETLRLKRLRKWIPAPIRRKVLRPLSGLYPESVRGKGPLDTLVQEGENLYHTKMLFFNARNLGKLLKGDGGLEALDDRFHAHFETMRRRDFLSAMQYMDLKTYLPMDILTKVDRASMAVSLEARVPILDHRVVEWAARVPVALQRKGGVKKYLMKTLLRREFGFDDSFLNRPKQGFDLPIDAWFKGEIGPYTREILLAGDAQIARFLNQDYVSRLLAGHQRGYRNSSRLIWMILILEHWLRVWGRYL
jgi:asparagine synthase (glutamine-hydrolysing)